jgi:glutaredoxin
MDKRDNTIKRIIMITVIIAIIAIIFLVYYTKNNGNAPQITIDCIASKSTLVVSKTCSACAAQKQILAEDIDKFNLVDISENPELFEQYNIRGVPTWIIYNKTYVGVRNIEELKEITGCK